MVYSKKLNLFFIAVPKTGTTSVENELLKLDPNAETSRLTLEDRIIHGRDMKNGILGHARAKEIRNVMGKNLFNSLNTFAFIRNPYDKLISAYFFTKSNHWFLKKQKNKNFRVYIMRLRHTLSVLLAKSLPFYIWVFFYPYRSNYSYVLDINGDRIVDYIGRTEHLELDLLTILNKFKIDSSKVELKHLNRSSHKDFSKYYSNNIFKKLVGLKINKDLELYNSVCKEMEK